MPFPVLHVLCGTIAQNNGSPLLSKMFWSQSMGSPGTTESAAPGIGAHEVSIADEALVFEIFAGQDTYVSISHSPKCDASILVGKNETRHIECKAGDRVAWYLV